MTPEDKKVASQLNKLEKLVSQLMTANARLIRNADATRRHNINLTNKLQALEQRVNSISRHTNR